MQHLATKRKKRKKNNINKEENILKQTQGRLFHVFNSTTISIPDSHFYNNRVRGQ